MKELPFDIPQSLNSYITQYRNNASQGIESLKAHLKKRGMDPVGFFLLSWFYHHNKQQNEAVFYALKAKCCAPGSPFFESLHYFLVHPDRFHAWMPGKNDKQKYDTDLGDVDYEPVLDLDRLIKQLLEAEKKRITISMDGTDDCNLGEKSERIDDIASETLAEIFEKQQKYSEAENTLKKLMAADPDKSEKYEKEIRRIRTLKNQNAG